MDKTLLIKLIVVSAFLLIFIVYALIQCIRLYVKVKKHENGIPVKRKIFKRKNSNVYDLKTSRTKK